MYMQKKLCSIFFSVIFVFSIFTCPMVASAHEVYVLSPTEVQTALHTPSVAPLTVIEDESTEFSLYAFIAVLTVFFVFFISVSERFERWANHFLIRLKKYAPLIGRIAIGLSFIAGAYYQASYGPELPLVSTYGHFTPIITALLYSMGVFVILGIFVQYVAFFALAMFGVAVYFHGWYMLTYVNYLGELSVLLIAGAGSFALQKTKLSDRAYKKMEQYGFFISRVLFGTALIYASAYAKLIHSNLGLDTVLKYHLTNYLHFEPHFLVLGAALVEMTVGIFFIFGIEIRFVSCFLLFWLTLSLLFFGEVVWPHLILIGIPIAFFCYGYDQYSLEGHFFKKYGREPVM